MTSKNQAPKDRKPVSKGGGNTVGKIPTPKVERAKDPNGGRGKDTAPTVSQREHSAAVMKNIANTIRDDIDLINDKLSNAQVRRILKDVRANISELDSTAREQRKRER